MITINFFNDGAYIKGHDIQEICTNISYAMWCCINDCMEEDSDVTYYESANDENWKHLGFTYVKINTEIESHVKIFDRFKNNIYYWVETIFPKRVNLIFNHDQTIDWKRALEDAKREQGVIS